MPGLKGGLHGLKADPSARADDQDARHGGMLPAELAWGFASLSPASSCARPSLFSASGTDLSPLSAAISFLICSGGSVNFLVCGSMPYMIIAIFIDASSYSARLAKPLFLAIAPACASTFGSGLSGSAPS